MPPASLADRRNDLTRRIILDAAVAAMEESPASALTMRTVAERANISERTVFRYFASRDELLDAVADTAYGRLEVPPPPASVAELRKYPRALYERFEARANFLRAMLQSEISVRIRRNTMRPRWEAVGRLVDELAPRRSARERRLATANIRYYLAASTWHYFRTTFGLSLEDSTACAEMAIGQALDALGRRAT